MRTFGRPEAVLDVSAARVSRWGGEVRRPMIAAPGGGKGTQGKRLAAKFSVQHVSSGEVPRAEARVGTPAGRELAAYQERHAADTHRSRMA
jgi:Adenylate kinase